MIDIMIRLPRSAIEDTLLPSIAGEGNSGESWLRSAKALLSSRKRRSACFEGIRFYDPSWDMILELYVADREQRTLSVSQLCSLSGGSTTTALRHIEHMEALGYIRREPDTEDRRRANVAVLHPLRTAAEAWLDLRAVASKIGT